METVVLVLHYFVCAFLIVVILLQAGKGADIGAAFGGASQTVFGSRGAATFLSKLTTAVAIVFLMTSITLASFSRHKSESVIPPTKSSQSLPVVPGESMPSATGAPKASPAPNASPVPASGGAPAALTPAASPKPTPAPH